MMVSNRGRFNPYKIFKFRVVVGAALAAVAGFAVVKKLMPRAWASKRKTGARPIETVGTSTPAFVGLAPKKRSAIPARRRKGPRSKAGGKS
jgi:hypothetical protein